MRTEEAVQTYWNVSLTWEGRAEAPLRLTYESAQQALHPLYVNALHSSIKLQSQAEALSNRLVKSPRKTARPKRMPQNVVQLPIRAKKAVAA